MSTPAEKAGWKVGDYGVCHYPYGSEDNPCFNEGDMVFLCKDDGSECPGFAKENGEWHYEELHLVLRENGNPDYVVTPEKDSAVTDEDWPRQGPDYIHHPPHYTKGDIECIEAIEAALGREGAIAYCRGNAMKYLWRACDKGDAETDLRKAVWYCQYAANLSQEFGDA